MTPLLAALFERFFGYSDKLVAAIGHPVIWIGWLISKGEAWANRPEMSFDNRKIAGAILFGVLLVIVYVASFQIAQALRFFPFAGWLLEPLVASSLLAQKGLRDAVVAVARALHRDGLAAGRIAVSHIVGRDTSTLDEAGISRAAIETLAENTSDGVIAPLFWMVLFGLPGAAVYKAINTADSMVGHRSERYAAFGWAPAKLDDLANWIPARVTALIFVLAARLTRNTDPDGARMAALRDAKNHASPNAGWPEAAMAGALGIALGGPRDYGGQTLDLPTMGEGRVELDADDIARAIKLYDRALHVTWAGLAVLWLIGL